MNSNVCLGITGDGGIGKILLDTLPTKENLHVEDYERGIFDLRFDIMSKLSINMSLNFIIMGIHKNGVLGIKSMSSKTGFQTSSYLMTTSDQTAVVSSFPFCTEEMRLHYDKTIQSIVKSCHNIAELEEKLSDFVNDVSKVNKTVNDRIEILRIQLNAR